MTAPTSHAVSPPGDPGTSGTPPGTEGGADLRYAPPPKRFARRFTLMVMLITLVLSVLVAIQLVPEVRYAFEQSVPTRVGDLATVPLDTDTQNRFVQAKGELTRDALGYTRLLASGQFWLSPVKDRPQLWVEVHVPAGMATESFVPPTSFVGRLVPLESAGPRYRLLARAAEWMEMAPSMDPWVLIDGETPRGARWSAAVCALLVAFAAFNLWGIFRLTRRVS